MQQAASMEILQRAGLLTPESHQVRASDLSNLSWDADQLYYCRATVNGQKQSVPIRGSTLASVLLERAGTDITWLVQPLYDFPIGGAAFVDGRCLYIEVAQGSTISLLRRGELGYAAFYGDVTWTRLAKQQTAWRYSESELKPQRIKAPLVESDAALVCQRVVAQLEPTEIRGLLEWAQLGRETYFLDLKPIDVTGQLPHYVRTRLHTSDDKAVSGASMALPDIDAVKSVPDDSPLTLSRGSRLSHAVTYRCARGSVDNRFLDW